MSHSNSVKNPTVINLDATLMDSPSEGENDVPSQPYRLTPEYVNLCKSGLSWSKIIQNKYKREKIIPKLFGLIYLFAYVAMYATKSIIP